jgi:uncharacterized MAPEG superfamily protein
MTSLFYPASLSANGSAQSAAPLAGVTSVVRALYHPCQDNAQFDTVTHCSASGGTMTIAEWCIFGTVILYLLTIAPVKAIGFRRFDNSKPRDPAFYDNPIAARALGAHLNGIETFPFFATAVLLAEFRAGPQRLIDELAVLFLIVRIAYVFTYLGDRPTLRTILWNIGFAINVAIFFMPAIRGFLPI